MKRLLPLFLALTLVLGLGNAQTRQRHIIYILDCTKSMKGYNGTDTAWEPTKDFIRQSIENEGPDTKITILPFQHDVKPAITGTKKQFKWADADAVLNGYVDKVTETNIVRAWDKGTGHDIINPADENIIILLTDGADNAKGNTDLDLQRVFSEFCEKAADNHAHGYYVKLTDKATIPVTLQRIIDNCQRIKIIDSITGIGDFNEVTSDNLISLTTRSLPDTVHVSFSNPKKIKTWVVQQPQKYIKVSAIGEYQTGGRLALVVSADPVYGDNVENLNKAIGADQIELPVTLDSEIKITEGNVLNLVLRTQPARSLTIADGKPDITLTASAQHTNSFLWIDETPSDTITFDMGLSFNQQAIDDKAIVHMQIEGFEALGDTKVIVGGKELKEHDFRLVAGESDGIIKLVVPAGTPDTDYNLKITYIDSEDLDLINDHKPIAYTGTTLSASYTTAEHWLYWVVFWLGIILVTALILWFVLIRRLKYPKFGSGTLTISSPYYQQIRISGARKIIFSATPRKQSFINQIFTGRIINHVNPIWTKDAEIEPSYKSNIRFSSANNSWIATPSNSWRKAPGSKYTVMAQDGTSKIVIEYQ